MGRCVCGFATSSSVTTMDVINVYLEGFRKRDEKVGVICTVLDGGPWESGCGDTGLVEHFEVGRDVESGEMMKFGQGRVKYRKG